MMLVLSFIVFATVMILVVRRPKGWNEAYVALPGAGLLLAAGAVGWDDVGYLWRLVWNATLSLLGIMALTALMDEIGVFRWAAIHLVRRFQARRMRLLIGLAALSGLITTFLNNDGTILIMTPIVLEATALLGMRPRGRIAFLLAVGLMADTASSTLLVSNLTNILTADYFEIPFADYAARMLLPGLVAGAATIGVLALAFRRTLRDEGTLPAEAAVPDPATAVVDRPLFRLSWLLLCLMMIGYAACEALGAPVSAIACLAAAALWIACAARKRADTRRLLRRTPWLIVAFALSMYVIVYSLHLHGATDGLPALLSPLAERGAAAAVFGSGLLFSGLAAAMNNLPAVLVSSLAIAESHGPATLPYASLIGLSVGAKLTPIGSLATLLWLGLLRREGVTLTWRQYVAYAIPLTVPVLLISLAVLWLQELFG